MPCYVTSVSITILSNDVMSHGVPVCCSSIVYCHWGLWVPKVYSMLLHTHLCSAMYTGTYGQYVYVEGV